MMDGYDGGMGAGGWLVVAVLLVGLIALIVWATAVIVAQGARDSVPERSQGGLEEILDRRLATGEIDTATYDALHAKLSGGRTRRGWSE